MTDILTRSLAERDAKQLDAGAEHYTAYVGPPGQYDFMGATQFRLLCSLGLREHHKLLDFGCGSLRAGRLLMPYLNPGCYHAVEPNRWLIEDALDRQIGRDMVRIKRPTFSHADDFTCDQFNTQFDWIIAQSIFTHAGRELIDRALKNFHASLAPEGIALVTFWHAPIVWSPTEFEGSGWVYPDSVAYYPETIVRMITEAGFLVRHLPWYHPRQHWYLATKSPSKLPSDEHMKHLRGAVLFDPEFAESLT